MDEIPNQPPEPGKPDPLVRAVGSLTKAVWSLVGMMVVAFGVFVYALLLPMLQATRSISKMQKDVYFDGKLFNELPTEKQVKYASVILITKHETTPARVREVIAEILKVKPGTEFHYKVGDELPDLSMPAGSACQGDGDVVFMVGSPAQLREVTSYTGPRLDGNAGLLVADLREEAKREGK